jgi:hypothetical protein
MSIGSRLVIVKPLDAFASAPTIPARHSAAKSALALKQEGGRHKHKPHGQGADGNSR